MNLEEYMDQEGITRAQLCEFEGVTESTLKRIFKGEGTPNENTTKKLAQALDKRLEELKVLLNSPPSSDYVAGLVYESLNKLTELGLSFKRKGNTANLPTYKLIEQDFHGDFSYFPNEFESLIEQASAQKQLDALKELLLHCTGFMVERKTGVDIIKHSQITLSGGSNACELRIFINTNIGSLESVKFQLHTSKETGIPVLAPIEGAHEIGYSETADEREMLRTVLEQINEKEQLINEKCPLQLRQGHQGDFTQFKKYYDALNKYLHVRKNQRTNVFVFSKGIMTRKLLRFLAKCLPALRVMTIQCDQGQSFLITGDLKIQEVLTDCLRMIAKRENTLPNTREINQEKPMSENNANTVTNNFFGSVENATTQSGDNNQLEINTKLNELLPVLRELQAGLEPTLAPDSTELKALDKAIAHDPKSSDYIKLLGDALTNVKKLINLGSPLAKLYNKAESVYQSLEALI